MLLKNNGEYGRVCALLVPSYKTSRTSVRSGLIRHGRKDSKM